MAEEIKRVVAVQPVGKLFERVFNEGIAPACAQAGKQCARLEAEFSDENRFGSICGEIEKNDLVLMDITARNPNVMYLAGYAHGIGKRIVFLAQHGEDLPFDKAKHEVIVYSGNGEFLREELGRFLGGGGKPKATEWPRSESAGAREKFLSLFGDLMAAHQQEHRGEIQLENDKTFVLLNQDLDLALVQDLARRARELGLRIKLL
jgi:hypothetical protein